MNPTHKPTTGADTELTPVEVLHGAATYLQRHGWTTGGFYLPTTDDPLPAACAVGAIRMAATGTALTDELGSVYAGCDTPTMRLIRWSMWALVDWLGIDSDTDDLVDDIATWNDGPARSIDEVITALRGAADAYHHLSGGAP